MNNRDFKSMNNQINPSNELRDRIESKIRSSKDMKVIRLKPVTIVLSVTVIILIAVLFINGLINQQRLELDNTTNVPIQSETDSNTSEIHTQTPEPENTIELYIMKVDDFISEEAPNSGELILSSGVQEFLQLDISDNQYLAVEIKIWFSATDFPSRSDFIYDGKSISEWENDPLIKEYDNYMGEFKELYSESKEYEEHKANGNLDVLYKEYLTSIANDENNLLTVINQYVKYQKAVTAFETEKANHYLNRQNEVYSNEVTRLESEGLYVTLNFIEESYYVIRGELNQYDLNNFPIGEYGYTIKLIDTKEPIDE